MPEPLDPLFFERADAFIHLANEQLQATARGKVSASFMYALARFNAWVSACGFESSGDMEAAREDTIRYFVEQYTAMLRENLDDYTAHFDKYMKTLDR